MSSVGHRARSDPPNFTFAISFLAALLSQFVQMTQLALRVAMMRSARVGCNCKYLFWPQGHKVPENRYRSTGYHSTIVHLIYYSALTEGCMESNKHIHSCPCANNPHRQAHPRDCERPAPFMHMAPRQSHWPPQPLAWGCAVSRLTINSLL